MSHSPLLNLPGPPPELMHDIETAIDQAAAFVADFDPQLTVVFAPDHYNGFFLRLMPPFCIGTSAQGIGDYGTYAGPLNVAADLAADCAAAVLDRGVDVAVSAGMDVDHAMVQPLQRLFGDATACPVIPIFINAVAAPLGPIHRARALGAAVGDYLATLDLRVLILGSGGLSHDPPIPTLATAPPVTRDRLLHGTAMSAEQRQARQEAVIAAARDFAAGTNDLAPLNPDFDRRFLALLDSERLDELADWSNAFITEAGGGSAHEIRTWAAAFAALAAQGGYRTVDRYYRPAPELIAGFAIRTAERTEVSG
ncbi:3-carboxyethylcatechol 2,3-dioxygenase [Mycolicibacter sinensis]|uniref:2,3-dihydroxyphenylpropionate/2,3-dihydroxicinnamic acid 1,2-dioxygenase n=1 Tax=Mycolicibacter sinensis (strain JDM601) TaxID=875328 RepID=A0A1A2EVC0_MYCSD|nr:3-carboxyethylcatechol 2,3-dioxygenase [Mycolicibacter sinensis]OBF97443.1 3-(2,3-dihydroxyphenyl)propionate dioxygenase [Mycolicibacter sinensis]OBG08100.1 3-(2,3-dihydroxyphenyl)propionate dioxygenase [Mycolicibacter sinensis]